MPFFRTEEGIRFWKSRRFDLGHLRNNVHQSATLVAIDVAIDRQGVRDIGIAVLPDFSDSLVSEELQSLDFFFSKYQPRVYHFNIAGQRVLGLDRIERLHWGQQETVDEDCIEERVVNLLRDFPKESKKELGLVLFSGNSELRALAHLFPTASPLFSW